jgi:iron complex outermembrane receptor protein
MTTLWSRSLLLLVLARFASAQSEDLTSLSLEDFMNIEVTSVNKVREKLSRSAAAVFVITQEDIRRSGAGSLPEVLRMAPGVHAAHVTGTTWAVGIRGFNNVYSNKLLVMIDGRTIYSPVFSGVIWNQNLIMLEEIERIEVIRGPGGTMWGANAVTGVINIITKNASATTGGFAALSSGNREWSRARVRYGGAAGRNGYWRTWGQYSVQNHTFFRRDESVDPWVSERGGLRFDWDFGLKDKLQVEVEVQRHTAPMFRLATQDSELPASSNPTGAGGQSGFAMGRWQHTTGRGDELSVKIYHDEEALNFGWLTARLRTLDFDVQHSLRLSRRHEVIVGGGIRWNVLDTAGAPQLSFDPAGGMYHISNLFAQDEWELVRDRLVLTGGIKLEHYTTSGSALQPTAKLIWTPTRRQGYWVSVSRAVRTPAHTDYALRLPTMVPGIPVTLLLMGSEEFEPESLRAFEAGSRFQIGRRLALDVAGFVHSYSGLLSYGIPPLAGATLSYSPLLGKALLPVRTMNGLNGLNRGLEAAVFYEVRPGWKMNGSYTSLSAGTSYRAGFNARNSFAPSSYSPEHQWQVRSSWDFARNWESDVTLYRSGAFSGGALPGYNQLDARIGRRFGEFTELSVSGRNLLRPFQQEFPDNLMFAAGLVRRSVEAGVRWRF